jgi:hypothetical protein
VLGGGSFVLWKNQPPSPLPGSKRSELERFSFHTFSASGCLSGSYINQFFGFLASFPVLKIGLGFLVWFSLTQAGISS